MCTMLIVKYVHVLQAALTELKINTALSTVHGRYKKTIAYTVDTCTNTTCTVVKIHHVHAHAYIQHCISITKIHACIFNNVLYDTWEDPHEDYRAAVVKGDRLRCCTCKVLSMNAIMYISLVSLIRYCTIWWNTEDMTCLGRR